MWNEDDGAKQLLQELGIQFTYKKNIPISSLNVEKSKRLNARFHEPINLEMCEKYAYSMKSGVIFPCLVIHGDLILAGNNRTHAAILAGRTMVDAYVITEATPQQVDFFTRRDNTRHGLGLTKEEQVQQCVDLHLKYETSLTELNKHYFGGNLSMYDAIKIAVSTQKVADTLKAKAIDVGRLTTRASLAPLYKFRENINVLTDIGRAVVEFDLPATQAKDLADRVYEGQTEKDRLALIVKFRKDRTTQVRTGKVAVDARLKKEINSFLKYLNVETATLVDISDPKERTEYRMKISDIIDKLRDLKTK